MDKMVSDPGRYQNNDYYKCDKHNVVFQPFLPVREEHVGNGLAAVNCEKKPDKTNYRGERSRRIFGASNRSFNVYWTAIRKLRNVLFDPPNVRPVSILEHGI